ncbi:MAG: type II secretion system F family protein [Anaerolineae bacterium]|nr:type II secretion system F family protein [Anaerolineae bacterium]
MNETLLALVPALLAGGLVVGIVFAATARPRRVVRAQRETTLDGIQVRLDRAQLGVSAGAYVTRSLLYGAAFGLLMALATGAWLTFPAGLVAGFAFVWSRLEDERNERLNRYHKALASAADTIVNSWRVRPSMNRALEAVATYGQGEVAGDFEQVRRAMRGGSSLPASLQAVADGRQSPVFDALATALIVAEEASGEVSEMLARQAASTRQMAVIYEETIDEQRGQRTDVMWGIAGPWGIMALLRIFTIATGGLGYGTEFFQTLPGQVAAVVAAVLTVVAYVNSHRVAGRGLVVQRVALERGKEPA